jgi:hypothetical protein
MQEKWKPLKPNQQWYFRGYCRKQDHKLVEIEYRQKYLSFLKTTSFGPYIKCSPSSPNPYCIVRPQEWSYAFNQITCSLVRDLWEYVVETRRFCTGLDKLANWEKQHHCKIKPDTKMFLCWVYAKRYNDHHFLDWYALLPGIASDLPLLIEQIKQDVKKGERASLYFVRHWQGKNGNAHIPWERGFREQDIPGYITYLETKE